MAHRLKLNFLYYRDKIISRILTGFLWFIQHPRKKKVSVFFITALCVLVLMGILTRRTNVRPAHPHFESKVTAKGVSQFLDKCLVLLNDIYRIGHNETIKGIQETKTWVNNNKDVTGVQLSINLYVAKGYFERMLLKIDQLPETNKDYLDIKNFLRQAAKTRIDSINLYTTGFLLKEQIGKTMISNYLADQQNLTLLPVPLYHGEIEEGLSKIRSANELIVEAICKMKLLSDRVNLSNFYLGNLATLNGFYTETSESDADTYRQQGHQAATKNDYFSALTAFNKVLKILPEDREAYLGLAEIYQKMGDQDKFDETLEKALKMDPQDPRLLELKAKGM